MDAIYGVQRHFYDATRKYYLLGRDELLRQLQPGPGQSVLEVGCGTGRNLAAAARLYPSVQLYGLDISAEMLKSAAATLARSGTLDRCQLTRADASNFDAMHSFGVARFDRIFLSYTLSMIPDWRGAIAAALAALGPGGGLHIVDFGDQAGLPPWFGRLLRGWLGRFHVTPRPELFDHCRQLAHERGWQCIEAPLYRGYAWSVVISS